ncbi:hypothetical protein ACFL0M_14360 [Thermodesulfobacteriota bacterium]
MEYKTKPSPVANVYPPWRAPPIISDTYPIPRCRVEALGEDRSIDDYVIDPGYTARGLHRNTPDVYPVETI